MTISVSGLVGQSIADQKKIIVEVSDYFLEMVHYDRSDLIGRDALSFTFKADLACNGPMLDRLAGKGPDFSITKRYVRGDGRIIWVQNQVSAHRDSTGRRYLCATSQVAHNNIRDEILVRRYDAVRRLCSLIVAGRAALGAEIVSLPATEILLLLYKAEIEGSSLTIEELTHRAATSKSAIGRWVAYLTKRGLVEVEGDVASGVSACIRISRTCEMALDGVLTDG